MRRGHLGLDEPGSDGVDGRLRPEHAGLRADHADHAGLGGGVVGLAAVAGDAAGRRQAHHACVEREHACLGQSRSQAQRGHDVHRDHRVPAVGRHVGQQLVAGDPGVVHDDVQAAEPGAHEVDEALWRLGVGQVELQCGAADLDGDLGQPLSGGGHVDQQQTCAVARQGPGDVRADAARRAGHQGDLACQWELDGGSVVRVGPAGRVARPADRQQLAVDEGRPRRQEEAQCGERRRVGDLDRVRELDAVAGRPATQLLGE